MADKTSLFPQRLRPFPILLALIIGDDQDDIRMPRDSVAIGLTTSQAAATCGATRISFAADGGATYGKAPTTSRPIAAPRTTRGEILAVLAAGIL